MIQKSDDRVWVYNEYLDEYYLLGAGLTRLEEVCKTALLETPNINSALCKREILYHTAQLEFEGIRTNDPALSRLLSCYLKNGEDALVTFIIANRKGIYFQSIVQARKVKGYVCIENPGTGEGVFGSQIKGKIVYAEPPVEGVFNEETKTFG